MLRLSLNVGALFVARLMACASPEDSWECGETRSGEVEVSQGEWEAQGLTEETEFGASACAELCSPLGRWGGLGDLSCEVVEWADDGTRLVRCEATKGCY